MASPSRLLLSFDVEEWFHANYDAVGPEPPEGRDDRLIANIRTLLELCAENKARATFFILGGTAERHPGLVETIRDAGHEIASHGFSHRPVSNMTPKEFEADLDRSLDILKTRAGTEIVGYRAPSWSVHRDMDWFFDILESRGFLYDSSLFPAKTYLYGDNRIPRFPFRIGRLLEIPPSTLSLAGRRMPFSGGAAFRVWPYAVLRAGLARFERRGRPGIVYLHPREVDPGGPRLPLPLRDRIVHYAGLKTARKKLSRLLAAFPFISFREYIDSLPNHP
jgi:polysaccharide deacetylase family protein (PEP-CTERM system associated)